MAEYPKDCPVVEDHHHGERRKEVEFSTPLGKVKLFGYDIFKIITIAALSSIGTLVWQMHDEHRTLAQLLKEQNYILLMPQDERDKVRSRIQMPPSLREKIDGYRPPE